MIEPFADVLKGFGQRLRYRQRLGGHRLPNDLAVRLMAMIERLEQKISENLLSNELARIHQELQGCARCDLHRYRKNVVVGEGNPGARLVFVGEGPGEEEDLQGRPFVGPAGQLLTRIIQAMDLSRQQVFIANVVKCRPPGNRIPNPDEIATCSLYLYRQLRAISPEVICTLGAVAAQTVLGAAERISKLRGRIHQWEGVPVMPTYHPSYLLRNPERKRDVWEDMKKIIDRLQMGSP